MNKFLGKMAACLSALLVVTAVIPPLNVKAAEDYTGDLSLYIAFGGTAENGDIAYISPDSPNNSEGLTAVNATAKVGDTVTISLELPVAISKALFVAPVIYTEDDSTVFSYIDADVSLKVNDEEVVIEKDTEDPEFAAHPQATGEYEHAWNLYGGYDGISAGNVPQNTFDGAVKIEYTITINSVKEYGVVYDGDALVFLGFEGSAAGGTLNYHGPDAEDNSSDINASYVTAKAGDTVTVSLEFPSAITHADLITPVIVSPGDETEFTNVEVSVALKIDGSDTPYDTTLGRCADPSPFGPYVNSWKMFGGTDTSGISYVESDVFAGATRIDYMITIHEICVAREIPEPEPEPEPDDIVPEEITPSDPVTPAEPIQPVEPAENTVDTGLILGIVIAVIAVCMIIAGVALSRDLGPKEKKKGKDDKPDEDAFDAKDLDVILKEEREAEAEEVAAEAEAEEAEADNKSEADEEAVTDTSSTVKDSSDPEEIEDLQTAMKKIDSVIAAGPYKDNWSSLSKIGVPEWFSDSRFGIFVHWGVFTSEEFANEWYPHGMYIKDSEEYKHHVEKYGPHTETGYKDYVERFKGENFDPDEWMELFKKSGAKYVVPVGEHHDGFQMYKSKVSHWNAFEKGPHRDIVGELQASAEKLGLHFGVSSHRIEHWWFLGNGRGFDSDINGDFERGDLYWPSMPEPENVHDYDVNPAPSEEFMQDWLVRVCEIVDRFHPEVLYFDWWIAQKALKPYLKKAAAYYYNVMDGLGLKGVIVSKCDAFAPGASVPDIERGGLSGSASYIWQSDTPICHGSWGYVPGLSFKTDIDIVRELVDIVSKNGNLLLNVGPKADGKICDEEKEVLAGVGKWLAANGEMIYGTTPYKIFGEGSVNREEGGFKDEGSLEYTSGDFRFTQGGGCVYAAAMAPAKDGHYIIKSFAKSGEDGSASYKGLIENVTVLETGESVTWEHLDSGLDIKTFFNPENGMPVVFKIELQ